MTIIFWDIPSTVGPWSPNTWKVRYCLNLKGIPYKTEWIEYPDIAEHFQTLGIAPTSMKKDGVTPYYTLPAIYDPSTNLYISDSSKIAEYLERQYPDTPSAFPHNTMGLTIDFEASLSAKLSALRNFIVPDIYHILNPRSQVFYRPTREESYNMAFEDIAPKGEEGVKKWEEVEAGFAEMAVWYSKNNDKGPFLMGDGVCWADFVVGGRLIWAKKAWGENDTKWSDILSWQGGVWKNLIEALKEYETIID
ncbi:hypothetical protein BJ912DRAFT_278995 [Pholiota molesta]|nr:hypothetical protein BJ912DRAFT_278995 [Pholiota molesta]